jgi:hypothetical protein
MSNTDTSHDENDLFAIEKIEFYRRNEAMVWLWRIVSIMTLGLLPLIDYRYLGSRLSLLLSHSRLFRLYGKNLSSSSAI